jgi:cobaltochelatase CobN
MPRIFLFFLALILSGSALATDKVALLSTNFVLERKFQLLAESAKAQGVELAWTIVDKDGEAGVKRVLDGARLVIIDAPRSDDTAQIERVAGQHLRAAALPGASINVMSPPNRLKPLNLDGATAQQLFEYYVGGTVSNRERLFQFLKTWIAGGDLKQVPPPVALPNGGIYHPAAPGVFATLPAYLAWWETRHGAWKGKPVIGMEMSSSYLSDGQTRMLDETAAALEQAGALPLLFYRASRVARAATEAQPAGRSGGRPERPQAAPANAAAASDSLFPNPKPTRVVEVNEPLITLDGQVLPQVLLVNTFSAAIRKGARPGIRRWAFRSSTCCRIAPAGAPST